MGMQKNAVMSDCKLQILHDVVHNIDVDVIASLRTMLATTYKRGVDHLLRNITVQYLVV